MASFDLILWGGFVSLSIALIIILRHVNRRSPGTDTTPGLTVARIVKTCCVPNSPKSVLDSTMMEMETAGTQRLFLPNSWFRCGAGFDAELVFDTSLGFELTIFLWPTRSFQATTQPILQRCGIGSFFADRFLARASASPTVLFDRRTQVDFQFPEVTRSDTRRNATSANVRMAHRPNASKCGLFA